MKSRSTIIVGFILVLTCLSGAWAQNDAKLRAKVEAFYGKACQSLEAKDLDAFLSHLTDDYEPIFTGMDRESIQNVLRIRFMGFDQLRAGIKILDISKSGEIIKVACEQKIEGKSGNRDWQVIDQTAVIDLLVHEGNSLKIKRSTETDRFRLSYVNGRTYKDEQTGFSFAVPQGWEILPTVVHPLLQRCVFVSAPDMTSAAMLGYVKAPGASAQQAVEGDEAATKILSDPKKYELIKSGPISITGHQGFETESKFYIALDGRERHRRRIYFSADDLLYVLCFDAVPFKQWDQVKDGFQSILDSIRLEN